MAAIEGGTLIYSPGVSIVIESAIAGPIDVSAEASAGSLTLRENGAHSLQFTLENPQRKYDGLFTPNDRIVVQMKRFRWVQVFAGYLDRTPYFSTYPRAVTLSAQCSLKVLRHWPWDRGSKVAWELIHGPRNAEAQDGGMAEIVTRLLTEVAQWPADRIHIGRVPEQWYSKFERIYRRLDEDIRVEVEPILGVNPVIAGKPVGGFPPATSGIGTRFGAAINRMDASEAELESLALASADIDVAMATIRNLESGDNYQAINKGDGQGDWATGAYQFTDSTWNGYGGYSRAYLAPPSVQDQKAREMIQSIMSRWGNKLLNIPYAWYYPRVFTDPSWLDKIPAAHEGNRLTLRQYGYKWARTYLVIYAGMRGTPPLSGAGSAQSTSAGILYPIPSGINQLDVDEVGWGGHTNGHIPASSLSYSSNGGYGHPMAIESWDKLCEAASKEGLDLRGSMYRSAANQAVVGAMGAPVGRSNHGWGLAIDISVLVPNASITKKYPGYTNSQMYTTAEYQWLKANAYKYGWGHPSWAQEGGSKPEAWHWEFFAIYNFRNSGQAVQQGTNPFANTANGLGPFANPTSTALFSALALWNGSPELDFESDILFGYKALMNDEPLLPTIQQFLQAAGRSYCTAPNGDFIAWFPDYWGEYGIAGAMDVEDIELKDFTVDWTDEPLITHQFVEGASRPDQFGPAPQGIIDGIQGSMTRGVATVDMPNLLASLLNVKDASQYPWLRDPNLLLRRFGARVDRSRNSAIFGPHQEFWMAISKLSRAWAAQFQTRASMTFMPELFPGMLLRLPSFKVQMYITQVTHSWDFQSGFSTDAGVMAVSAMDGSGFYIFPKGGDLRPAGGGGRLVYR